MEDKGGGGECISPPSDPVPCVGAVRQLALTYLRSRFYNERSKFQVQWHTWGRRSPRLVLPTVPKSESDRLECSKISTLERIDFFQLGAAK